jgi:lipopolysaccharide/colanic/teichoic acid biosynthesis glycosyltransferase
MNEPSSAGRAEPRSPGAVDEDELVVYLANAQMLRHTVRMLASHLAGAPASPCARLFALGAEGQAIHAVGYDDVVVRENAGRLCLGARFLGLAPGRYRITFERLEPGGAAHELRAQEVVRGALGDYLELAPAPLELARAGAASPHALRPGDRLQLRVTRLDAGADGRDVYRSHAMRIHLQPGRDDPPPPQFFAQRLYDVAFSLAAGLAVFLLLGWCLVPYAIYVKLRTGHLFYQDTSRWVLKHGRLQCGPIHKLETMFTAPDGQRLLIGSWWNERGSRWEGARLAKFLRAVSLDELPQLWNVLKGEWSIYGPRACKNGQYTLANGSVVTEQDSEARYGGRAPGALSTLITAYGRGLTPPSMATRIVYDRYDREHWSFPLALRILFRTLMAFLWSEGLEDHAGVTRADLGGVPPAADAAQAPRGPDRDAAGEQPARGPRGAGKGPAPAPERPA